MHKIFVKYLVFIFVILCFTVNSTIAKTYNSLLTNKDNSKFRLITYNDRLAASSNERIDFPNNILFLNSYPNFYLIKFKNAHIKNAISIQTKDIPQLTSGVDFKQPYIKDNNILIPFNPAHNTYHEYYDRHYWNCHYGRYVFLTSNPIKISNDLNKIDTPTAVYTNGGYFFPFRQGLDRYLLYNFSLNNLFNTRTVFYLYKENKNTNTFQYQDILLAAHGANFIENNDKTIIQFDGNDDVVIQNGKVKYISIGGFLNHHYHSLIIGKDKLGDLKIDKADLTSIPKHEMHVPDPSYKDDFYIFNFPPVIKKFTDKMGNKYYMTDRYDEKVYFLLKINKNNTLDWIIRSKLNMKKVVVSVDEKTIKLKIEDGIYNVPYSKLPKSYWTTVKYTDTPLIINDSL